MSESKADRVERWAGPATGLIAAVVTMTGIALSDISGPDAINPQATSPTIAYYLAERTEQLQLGTTVLMIGLFFTVWFLVHLRTRLDPTGSTRWMASVASASGLIAVTLMALVVAYVRAVAETNLNGADSVIAKVFVILDWNFFRIWAPFVSAHMLAAGVAIVRTALLPKFIGWGAIAVAFAPLVLPPGMMTIVFFSWMAVLSSGLLVKGIRGRKVAA